MQILIGLEILLSHCLLQEFGRFPINRNPWFSVKFYGIIPIYILNREPQQNGVC